MSTPAFALTHLARQPGAGSGPPPLLILLHGVGSNEQDLFSLAPYLDRRLLILSARAPYPMMPGAYAWFELVYTAAGSVFARDPQQVERSRALLAEFIGQAVAGYGADAARVYLLGFSQGAMMSSMVALSRPDLVAGAALMSGRIPPEVRPLVAPPERLAGRPFLVIHGTQDPVLPVQDGRASRDLLATLPVELTYQEYPMGHEVSPASLAEVARWLSAQIDRSGAGAAPR